MMPIMQATAADVPELNELVNSAYRGETSKLGWTTESNLLDGRRIDEETLLEYFNTSGVCILKHVESNGNITGCVYLEQHQSKLYLGMFSVAPRLQGKGIGRKLLLAAEDYARKINCPVITMTVISVRDELINWYQRRGYQLTGEILPFHHDKKFGIPRQHIELAVLEKEI